MPWHQKLIPLQSGKRWLSAFARHIKACALLGAVAPLIWMPLVAIIFPRDSLAGQFGTILAVSPFIAISGAIFSIFGFLLAPFAAWDAVQLVLWNWQMGGEWVCDFGGAGSGIAGATTDAYFTNAEMLPGIVYCGFSVLQAAARKFFNYELVRSPRSGFYVVLAISVIVSAAFQSTYEYPVAHKDEIDCS